MSRRTLLVGGGASVGLVLAWRLWPRGDAAGLAAGPDETLLNAFLKIGSDGRVIVAVPQAEMGQGVWTSLPQILADELGADWRTVGVEPAPVAPDYANALLAGAADGGWRKSIGWDSAGAAAMATAGSTSIRAFEPRLREAGAAARALLMRAAARRWGAEWRDLDTRAGFVVGPAGTLSFAELAADAARESVPGDLPVRAGLENRLYGQSVPRLDVPAKIDGSAQFAADVRLPGLLYASVRNAPTPGGRLLRHDGAAAKAVAGLAALHVDAQAGSWIAAVASSWWAADRALHAAAPVWSLPDAPDDTGVKAALQGGLASSDAARLFTRGEPEEGPTRFSYGAGPGPNAALETLTATARREAGRLEIWAPAQAPALARAAAARAAGVPEEEVTLYRPMIGGGDGRKLEVRAVEQAAALATRLMRPVQVIWSRVEETTQDTFRPAATARLSARLGEGGILASWHARIAAPDIRPALAARLGPGAAALNAAAAPDVGAVPPYDIPNVAVDHVPVGAPYRTGLWRSGATSYTAFFTESFVDELARQAGIEPYSFRMQMLGGNPRLARCLSAATQAGGWDGGQSGSTMGIACLSAFGSHIATLVEVEIAAGLGVRVRRAVCAVDCGRVVHPDIVKQQVEGGLLFGIGAATGAPVLFEGGRPAARGFRDLALPGLSESPEVNVEIIDSQDAPGGASGLAVPTAAPAVANALFALTGKRLRNLPLQLGGAT